MKDSCICTCIYICIYTAKVAKHCSIDCGALGHKVGTRALLVQQVFVEVHRLADVVPGTTAVKPCPLEGSQRSKRGDSHPVTVQCDKTPKTGGLQGPRDPTESATVTAVRSDRGRFSREKMLELSLKGWKGVSVKVGP